MQKQCKTHKENNVMNNLEAFEIPPFGTCMTPVRDGLVKN